MKGLFILITVWVVLLFGWAQIVEPGALFVRVDFLTGDMLVEREFGKAYLVFFHSSNGATVHAMVTAEICAWFMSPASTIIHPVCSVGFIINNISVTILFLGFFAPFWLNISVVISTILVTNKGARAHVATSAGPALVRFSNPLPRASGLVNLTRPAPTLPTSKSATLCPVGE